MPVHAAGPKLYSSIPFKHLAQLGAGGSKAVNVSLNVVPFVDMMTILTCFLLMVFSASGELLSDQGIKLPDATNKDKLKQVPVLVISRDQVEFMGEPMASTKSIMDDESMEWKLPELYDRLRQEKTAFKMSGFDKLSDREKAYCNQPPAVPKPHEICVDGLLILQADKNTPAKVLNRVIKTAYAAEFPNLMFAVNRRSTRAQ